MAHETQLTGTQTPRMRPIIGKLEKILFKIENKKSENQIRTLLRVSHFATE